MQLSDIRGIGPKRLAALNKAGIYTQQDVLRRLPRAYFDLRKPISLAQVTPGPVCFIAQIVGVSERRSGRLSIVTARVRDEHGMAECVFFNQPYRRMTLKQGESFLFYGMAEARLGRIQINTPFVEDPSILEEAPMLPIYPAIAGMPQKAMRQLARTCLDARQAQADPLPGILRQEYGLCELGYALEQIHFPQDEEARKAAAFRLSFEEMLCFSLAMRALRERTLKDGIAHQFNAALLQNAISSLPYPLTGAQKRVLDEALADMQKSTPMQRLVQGDVGSGKTIIAMLALYACVLGGHQGAMMAPTEILARQHYESACEFFAPLGIRVGLLTGALTAAGRREALKAIESGEWQVVIGTHALIQKKVEFSSLGLAVVDEQHRFGVEQRKQLSDKGSEPDVLVMSATPIPRTLALILYGDLDVSLINEMPPGRLAVKTSRVPEEKRQAMLEFVQKQAQQGHQSYVVCPLVEETEAVDAPSAQQVAQELMAALPKLSIEWVHGRMKAAEKEQIIARFASGQTQMLVSTTVIEVGVNVPTATVMIIEGADRFGLAQLHQLRGRVGRSSTQSYCFLMAQDAQGAKRLEILTTTSDGFIIAEEDLRQRGPGQFLGTRQHGTLQFEFSSLADDMQTLELASQAAARVLSDPWRESVWPQLMPAVQQWAQQLEHIALN